MATKKTLTSEQQSSLLNTLKTRFEKNSKRHKGIVWTEVEKRLHANKTSLWPLYEMERTGGEPDVISQDKKSGAIIFCDCSKETPAGRRSICYDREALDARKEHKPGNNAMDMAADMGIDVLTEEQYRNLQKLGPFDTKTSSWLKTDPAIRKLGGAIFGDYRYGQVFIYHNGVQSYYAGRGFRGCISI